MPRAIEKRCGISGKGHLPSGLPLNLPCSIAKKLIRCVEKVKKSNRRIKSPYAICKAAILKKK